MKPIIIRNCESVLIFDKEKKHADIKISHDCKISEQILQYFLDLISSVNSLTIVVQQE